MMSLKIKPLYCFFSNDEEYKVFARLANLLANRLTLAAKKTINIELRCFNACNIESVKILEHSFVVCSLIHYILDSNCDLNQLRGKLLRLSSSSLINNLNGFYLMTIFPSYQLNEVREKKIDVNQVMRRIRALNMLALNLSHKNGFGVLDLDLLFTRLGGALTNTDYTLRGKIAHQIAADFICTALLEEYLSVYVGIDQEVRSNLILGGYEGVMSRASRLIMADGS